MFGVAIWAFRLRAFQLLSWTYTFPPRLATCVVSVARGHMGGGIHGRFSYGRFRCGYGLKHSCESLHLKRPSFLACVPTFQV